MSVRLEELAATLGLAFAPGREGGLDIAGFKSLDEAGPADLSFVAEARHLSRLAATRAGAVIAPADLAAKAPEGVRVLVSANPHLDFARALRAFVPAQGCLSGQSDLAFVHATAEIDPTATVYPFAFIGAGTRIGPECVIFPHVYVGENCELGQGCIIYPGCSLMAGTRLGRAVILQPGVILGGDGFGFIPTPARHEKIPQIGNVVLGDEVEIGSNTTVDRAALGSTQVKAGVKIDDLVMIAHNVEVGERSILVAQVGIAGSTKVGRGVIMSGQVGVVGHLEIGDGCRIGAKSGVSKSLPPGSDVSGRPAMPHGQYLRMAATMPKLPDMAKRLSALERELAELKAALGQAKEPAKASEKE